LAFASGLASIDAILKTLQLGDKVILPMTYMVEFIDYSILFLKISI
jgi:cystathionine beta-lyase/cystathionine gamma-synthase